MRTVPSTVAALAAVCAAAVSSPASAQVAGFSDVPANHWAAQSVAKLTATGIIKGNSAQPLGNAPAPAAAAPQAKPAAAKKAAYDGNKPVTRYELAVTLYRFVQYLEQADGQKKGKLKAQAAPVSDGKAAVARLIAGGYLPKTTPLAVNGATAVTANQLADAMAQVIAQSRVKKTPITPGSLKTLPIEHPNEAPGT